MSVEDFDAHLAGGITGVARCWKLTRRDEVVLGFTDHDVDVAFGGVVFRAGTGLSAAALSQSTGLAVDNTEAVGALSAAAITEADIIAGRYDDAEVEAWAVQWSAPENRVIQFRGTLGEISRKNGAFTAELRGLAERLNVPRGRVYQARHDSFTGYTACGVDLLQPGYFHEAVPDAITGGRIFEFDAFPAFEARWFERGMLEVLDGNAAGLTGTIKRDRPDPSGKRCVELWDSLRAEIGAGDRVRLTAGTDSTFETCATKFSNALDFRGFPDIPGEDWMVAHPTRVSARDGGSRR